MATKDDLLQQLQALDDQKRDIKENLRRGPGHRPGDRPRSGISIRDRLAPRASPGPARFGNPRVVTLGSRREEGPAIRIRRPSDRSPRERGRRGGDDKPTVTRKRRILSTVSKPTRKNSDDEDENGSDDEKDKEVDDGESKNGEGEKKESEPPAKKKVRTRDRRMLGHLMGHLARAKTDLKKNKAIANKRKQVEQQALVKQAEERTRLRTLQRQLHTKKSRALYEQTQEIARKQQALRMQLVALSWRDHQKALIPFLQTKADPPIFFQPVKHTEKTQALLAARKEEVESNLAELVAKHDEIVKSILGPSFAVAASLAALRKKDDDDGDDDDDDEGNDAEEEEEDDDDDDSED